MGVATVRGEFGQFEGSLEIGADLASSKATGSVQTASVDTNQDARDEHLRSADFFEVENTRRSASPRPASSRSTTRP